mmetsp:Transcript_36537/g.36135  ORF Transcript_36537/g.36135 Transcript_36537/m.36135 type:complete len:518 (-) Transcript_36537:23-1576(-)
MMDIRANKVFPGQNNKRSDVIIEDLNPDGPQPGYTGSRKRASDSTDFINKQKIEIDRISQAPIAGKIYRGDPDEKNWARYDDNEDPIKNQKALQGKTRSLVNEDILGAKPKHYGGVSSSKIADEYAGMSYGLQERLKNHEAPFGSGGNLDTTSYGAKWLNKTEKGIHNRSPFDNSKASRRKMDALDQERARLDSRNANLAGNDMGGILQQPNEFNSDSIHPTGPSLPEPHPSTQNHPTGLNSYQPPAHNTYNDQTQVENPRKSHSRSGSNSYPQHFTPDAIQTDSQPKGMSYIEQKKEELRLWKLQQEKERPYQPHHVAPQPEPNISADQEKEERKRHMEKELEEQMAKMNMNPPQPQNLPQESYPPQPTYEAPKEAYEGPEVANKARNSISYKAPPKEAPAYKPSSQDRMSRPRRSQPPSYQPPVPHRQMDMAAGDSTRKKNDDNSFSLSGGYGTRDLNRSALSPSVPNHFETSAMLYGNYGKENLSKALKNDKAHGLQAINKDKGFNVITGEFVG